MKKVLSILVVLSMLVSTLPLVAAHWADVDVAYLIENGAIAEDDAMLQNLDTPITRSRMVKVIVALLEGEEPIEGKEYFTDITAGDAHIAKAAENGYVNGFGDGTFRPNNPITRQDFFTIVGRAY
ncbi:MAG: S-layer homology domain-containing protein, partial [Clostridia bacterium]|nr:S-layer homology domain-containing protein [Clostridia bacterium]